MDAEPQGTQPESSPKAISPIVTVENSGNSNQAAIQDIDGLFRDISAYNDQFSLGASMAGMLRSLMDRAGQDEAEEPVPTQLTKSIDEDSQQMTASGLNVIHEGTLNNLGLSLEPVSGKTSTIYTSEGAVETGEMRLNIKDRSQFSAFLKALGKAQVTESPLGEHLGELTDILNKQILDNYNLDQPDDETLAFLGSLDTVVNEYKRLGLTTQAEQMEEYLQHSRQGNLREFVALKTSGLMQEPNEGFGPADWQKDASTEFLERKWQRAIVLLRQLRNNPNAQEMYRQLLDQLNRCLPLAQANLPELQYYTPERKQELSDILKTAQEGLQAFES